MAPKPKDAPRLIRRGGKASRQKGDRAERALVRYLQDYGLGAERQPLSGSLGGRHRGDVSIPVAGRDLIAECKVRAIGFGQIYSWLVDRDLLVIRADRREPLVVVPLRLAREIAVHAERGKAVSP